ncbi:hypothetical protein [Cyclobacterium plantarum]|uniref:Uncharacterized protein n=1 Tax=Cyclobacterium plantarum TaxID=2716263 RepID=A0ABX0HAY1_9BACT|nr:hypothetical protein [Cyclobacterium plantarum]NHE59055.1 hypothetical protein [Cyclobacterium plantarum]
MEKERNPGKITDIGTFLVPEKWVLSIEKNIHVQGGIPIGISAIFKHDSGKLQER